jgi:hypothetical protein
MGAGVGILLGTFLSYPFGYEGALENRPKNAIDSGVFTLLLSFYVQENLY